jgi:glycerol uptake facilitator-like aquaporin
VTADRPGLPRRALAEGLAAFALVFAGCGAILVYEAVLTAFLMFVIVAVATDTRALGAAAAIAIGGTVGLDALFGGPVTGASMNPARSFGPALAAGEGAFAYQFVRVEGRD